MPQSSTVVLGELILNAPCQQPDCQSPNQMSLGTKKTLCLDTVTPIGSLGAARQLKCRRMGQPNQLVWLNAEGTNFIFKEVKLIVWQ